MIMRIATPLAVILSLLAVLIPSVANSAPMKEARGLYVCRWDMASPKAIDLVVDRAAKYGYNVLVVQVRGSGDTLFKSDIEPRSSYLDDAPAGFDPLQYCIDAAHAKGIQVHAWLNTVYLWYSSKLHYSPSHISNAHPDWMMMDWNGNVIRDSGADTEGAYTCLSHDEAREHIASVFLEVTRKYNVDGIHFDFVRYPNRRVCYCDTCLAKFRQQMAGGKSTEEMELIGRFPTRRAYPVAYPDSWDQFRRDRITGLVRSVYTRSKAIKPEVAVSASVFPDWNDAANYRFQDWKRWAGENIVDFLCPMAYGTDTQRVSEQIKDAVTNGNGHPVWAGLGAWLMGPEQLAQKIDAVRKEGAVGEVMFDSSSLIGDGTKDDYLIKLGELCYKEPAQLPDSETAGRKQ